MKKSPAFYKSLRFIAFSLWLLVGAIEGSAQSAPSIFEHLSFDEVVKIDIVADFDSLVKTKQTEEKLPAVLSYKDAKGVKWEWNIELQVRGRFRRRICPFPPLFLDFSKKELRARGMNDHNDLKLVTHCIDDKQGDENILREYLAYKLYQIITSESYRVQLLRIRYQDSKTGYTTNRYGILLEDEDEMRARYNSKICEDCYSVPLDSMQMNKLHLHDLFQYMIGNSDWSLMMLRNIKLLKPKDGSKFIVVPYDFDFCGLVNAPYATPDPTLGIRTVRERRFLGVAQSAEELADAAAHLQSRKKELLNCIRKFKLLSVESRQMMIEYLESFYNCLSAGLDLQMPGKY